jgi:hypothetical protein
MPLIESFSGIRGIYDDGLNEKVVARLVPLAVMKG